MSAGKNHASLKSTSLLKALPIALLAATACATSGEISNVGYVDDGTIPTFAEFEELTYQDESGVYIVNGDTPIASEKLLREYYDSLFTSALIVQRNGNSDAKWDATTRKNLTYCVSNSFGSRKNTVVNAMAAATGVWEQAADIDFVYVSSQDGNCNGSNGNVLFDVRPTSNAPYLARAFFPGQSRGSRNVIIDSSAFNSFWPLQDVLGHELGHTLGFRHEHTRPEAGACFEDNNWRPLTPYDRASIMHYPQCNGLGNSLSFSQQDFNGAAALYGAPQGNNTNPDPDPEPTQGTPQSGSASGSVTKGQELNFQGLPVLGGTTITVAMTGTGDPDLYLRFDAAPTLQAYDCRPYLNGAKETCSVDVPAGASQAFIMIHGYKAANFNIDVNWTAP